MRVPALNEFVQGFTGNAGARPGVVLLGHLEVAGVRAQRRARRARRQRLVGDVREHDEPVAAVRRRELSSVSPMRLKVSDEMLAERSSTTIAVRGLRQEAAAEDGSSDAS